MEWSGEKNHAHGGVERGMVIISLRWTGVQARQIEFGEFICKNQAVPKKTASPLSSSLMFTTQFNARVAQSAAKNLRSSKSGTCRQAQHRTLRANGSFHARR